MIQFLSRDFFLCVCVCVVVMAESVLCAKDANTA